MHEIKSFGVLQTARLFAVMYAILSFFFVGWDLLYSGLHLHQLGEIFVIPVLFGIVGLFVFAFACWVYNFLAKRIGGIAFELVTREEG